MKKILKVLLYLILGLFVGLLLLFWKYNEKEPVGTDSPEVEAMTQTIYTNLNKVAWDSTDWVKWTFHGGHQYVWDKSNHRVQVRWDDYETILDLNTLQGPVKKAGVLLSSEAATKMAQKAYSMYCNDGFWLMAPFKITDTGTTRTLVTLPDGRKGLKVTYNNGGVTPGDSYVWILDAQGIPSMCKLWVSIIPVGGLESTWENWVVLPTGAKLSTFHLIGGGFKSEIKDVDGGMGAAPM